MTSAAERREHPRLHLQADGTVITEPDWKALAHHFADELVERWHRPDSAHALPLAQFMGLSDEQWAAWVEQRYDEVLP